MITKELLILLSVIIFWGYETFNIFFSIITSIFLSLPFLLNIKLKFSLTLFKFASLISFFLFAIVIYYYIHSNVIFFLGGVLKWAPLIFLPIISLELYSYDKKTPVKGLLLISENDKYRVSIFYYYIFSTVLATSSGRTDIIFYIFIASFFSLVLFSIKSKRYSYFTYLLTFLIIIISSFLIQNGASTLHKKILKSIIHYLMGIDNDNIDISKSRTRIGTIGDFKLSNEIIYRLKANKKEYPMYLREATYTKYFDGDWVAPKSKFKPFRDYICDNSKINTNNSRVLSAKLIGEFKKNSTLPLPTRTINISKNSKNDIFRKNNLIVIQREGSEADFIDFKYYKDKISCDKKFEINDLKVPKSERKYINEFISKYNLSSSMPVMDVLKKINSIFYSNFSYSLDLKKSKKIKSALGNFLLDSKAGHCEYFATSTVLVLRELGIPARYTVGYSVQEYSNWEENFIIRKRHAHSWVRVLINNHWYNYDTTPPDWNAIEGRKYSFFDKVSDFLSYIEYKITYSSIWNYLKNNMEYIIYFLIVLFVIIRYKNRVKYKNKKYNRSSKFLKKIDKILRKNKIIRNHKVPIELWLDNLNDIDKERICYHDLSDIIKQYYIYRFSDEKISKKRLNIIYKKIKKWKKLTKAKKNV